MLNHHWNYYAALEDDVKNLARYIHFSKENLDTYSIELARLLMSATQEIDVLFHQICSKHGDPSTKEQGYRAFFAKGHYSKIYNIKVMIHRYGLDFMPFAGWDNQTPEWWTANNKVKHERHQHFGKASLKHVLNSLSALLIANIYFASEMGTLDDYVPGGLLLPENMIKVSSFGASAFQYKLPQ